MEILADMILQNCRCEKMNSGILQWENDKKMKAKRRLERKEV